MKIFFDLLPVILFFIAFKAYDIFIATAVAIGATIAMIIYSKLVLKKVEKMLLINGAIIAVLGGITLLLHDKTFIMWKPTVLYWVGAVVLFVFNYFLQNNLIKKMMQAVLNPPELVWEKLNWLWIAFLIALGFLNLFVAYNFSENTWVNFKLFGITGIMFAFMIGQTLALRQYLITPPEENNQQDKEA